MHVVFEFEKSASDNAKTSFRELSRDGAPILPLNDLVDVCVKS